jgi:transcriptional regulator with XRE-family HTH domain
MAKRTKAVIGDRVRERREALGITQVALGKTLGIEQSNVSAIERGRAGVSLDRLIRLAEILECSLDDLTTP